MPTVESEIVIERPVAEVYALAQDIERFPEFMADVENVEILEDDPPRRVSRWTGVIKEFNRTVEWTEEDYWDAAAHLCTFTQLEGDFSEYSGRWKFGEVPAGTRVQLEVNYDYNVPLIGALIKNLLRKKMQQNTDAMLAALKEEAESAGEE